jgi:hypothetical protein
MAKHAATAKEIEATRRVPVMFFFLVRPQQ